MREREREGGRRKGGGERETGTNKGETNFRELFQRVWQGEGGDQGEYRLPHDGRSGGVAEEGGKPRITGGNQPLGMREGERTCTMYVY